MYTTNSPSLGNTGVVERGGESTTGVLSVYPPVWDILLPLAQTLASRDRRLLVSPPKDTETNNQKKIIVSGHIKILN